MFVMPVLDIRISHLHYISFKYRCFRLFEIILIQSHYIAGQDIDFNLGPHDVNFTAGSTNASFSIRINIDNVLEDDEKFNISIATITRDHTVGTPAVTTVTIIDTTGKHVQY